MFNFKGGVGEIRNLHWDFKRFSVAAAGSAASRRMTDHFRAFS
jgi:hypothetical protein